MAIRCGDLEEMIRLAGDEKLGIPLVWVNKALDKYPCVADNNDAGTMWKMGKILHEHLGFSFEEMGFGEDDIEKIKNSMASHQKSARK
eukprot:CAMPEP_0206196724 /NCGR_PEP_ID=MMETSP0166-20121206/8628_1 /ASSEMBLY_ACC=CAM_ASM_000260 /TAXON_ID=95228 /ORGANISM="Vannella robusta, Strain DIVA3 518/3/11/1/6" /LENGTH=87 /DNA_ID=CAMNT_0053614273 /DNA_START=387 /DNA_END=650 /DNA_ORIENTATION=+